MTGAGCWVALLVDLALVIRAHLKDLVQARPLLALLFLLLHPLLLCLQTFNQSVVTTLLLSLNISNHQTLLSLYNYVIIVNAGYFSLGEGGGVLYWDSFDII